MLYELVLSLQLALAKPLLAVAPAVPLASHSFSLDERYGNEFVNDVFKDNILLTLNYQAGRVKSKADINWETIEQPFTTGFTLKPGESFAFHEDVLPAYAETLVQTTNAHFNGQEGFKSDGYLIGDGVCHLASLLSWVAKDAGLTVYAPSNHNFAAITGVPKEEGVAVLSPMPLGNLYIVNNLESPVSFHFEFDGHELIITASDSIVE